MSISSSASSAAMPDSSSNTMDERPVHDGDAVVVPTGTYYNVFNASKTAPLRLNTIYFPPNHPDGTVQKTKVEEDAAEKARA